MLGEHWPLNLQQSNLATSGLIRMQHWRPKATDGAKFWISCKRPAFLSTSSRLQMIQNKRPWCCGAAYVEAGYSMCNQGDKTGRQKDSDIKDKAI